MAKHARYNVYVLDDRGATMVEFSLIAILFVGLVGVIFDVGIGLKNYSLLTYATSNIAREISVKPPCGNAKVRAPQIAQEYVAQRFGITSGVTFRAEDPRAEDVGVDFRIVGEWPLKCIFCLLSPRRLSLKAEGPVSIENHRLGCS